MEKAISIIDQLASADVEVYLLEGKLKARSVKGGLTPSVIELIKDNKQLLIQYLTSESVNPKQTTRTSVQKRIESLSEFPLSFAQQRLWFIDQVEGGSNHYNMPSAMYVTGKFDVKIATKTFSSIVARHEVLRTIFVDNLDSPLQKVINDFEFELNVVDLTNCSDKQKADEEAKYILLNQNHCFDLAQDLMLRVSYIMLREEYGLLLFNIHHIASDGWSNGILINEFMQYYAAFLAGKDEPFEPLAIQYADYAVWQRDWLKGDVLARQLTYWKDQLADIPTVHSLPLDRIRPNFQTFNGGICKVVLGSSQLSALQALAREQNATLFMVMHAAFSWLIAKYSRSTDIIIGTPVANRLQKELEPLIGFFVNTLVLRSDCSGDPTFKELLQQIKRINLDAQANQDVPFEHLVDFLNPSRSTSHNALFQILLTMNTTDRKELKLDNISFEPLIFEDSSAKFELVLNTFVSDIGLECTFQYNTDLFDEETIVNISECLISLLNNIAESPQIKLSQLDLVGETEKNRLLITLNDTDRAFSSELCVHQLFEQKSIQHPERTAIFSDDINITYNDLNKKANRLAHYLLSKDVALDDLVGVCFERSIDMFVAVIAILKSGCAYLPLDPNYPKERLKFIVADSSPVFILSEESLRPIIEEISPNMALFKEQFDEECLTDSALSYNPSLTKMTSKNLAYVIYTSGSTGIPKGVLIEHRGAVNLVECHNRMFNLSQSSRVLQFASLNFDAATLEWMMALTSGASLYVCNESHRRDPELLQAYLCKHLVTHAIFPPSLLTLLDVNKPYAFETLMVAGENFDERLVKKWGKNYSLYNGYGPTETTVCATVSKALKSTVNIGKAIDNCKLYVLNEYHQIIPYGAIGELYIGGVGLARGYLNRNQLSTEKFLKVKLDSNIEQRLYRTGDLVRYTSNGNLEFIGRVDDQVKIRGYRIELGEIEYHINEFPEVLAAVVVLVKNGIGEPTIAAYYSTKEPVKSLSRSSEIRLFLKSRLPEYMLPSFLTEIESIPLTPNGKVDRSKLPAPDLSHGLEFVEPHGDIEVNLQLIWSQLLKIPQADIGSNANFFELGGHSLLSVKLVSEIRSHFSIEISVKQVFESSVLTDMARIIALATVKTSSNIVPLFVDPTQLTSPSFAQNRLWFIDKMDNGSAHYNMAFSMKVIGNFNLSVAEQALLKIIQRHDTLRTVFVEKDNIPFCKLLEHYEFEIAEIDLSQVNMAKRNEEITRICREDAALSFNLTQDLMLRVTFIRLAYDLGIIVFNMHHIASDGWSMNILTREFSSLYLALSNSDTQEVEGLEALPIRYSDFASWQKNWLQGDILEEQFEYWRNQLSDLPVVHALPLDSERPKYQTHNGAIYEFSIGETTFAQLKQINSEQSVTTFMLLHAAFACLIARFSRSNDIVVGTPVANRLDKKVEPLIGFFVNTLVLRVDCQLENTFTEFLKQVKDVNLNAQAHQELPFELLVDELNPTRSTSHSALFQILISLNNNENQELSLPDLRFESVASDRNVAKFELTLNANESINGIQFCFQYNKDLFAHSTIAALGDAFVALLVGISQNPKAKLAALPLVSFEKENKIKNRLAKQHNNSISDLSFHHLFEQQVNVSPDRIALIFDGKSISYRELNHQANQISHYLIKKGVKVNTLIGLCFERSIEMVVALIAILKSGAAYVPLDPELPAERFQFMLVDSNLEFVLTQKPLKDLFKQDAFEVITIDELVFLNEINSLATTNPIVETLNSRCLAYAIYTSGTTGNPKAVLIEHFSIVNLSKNILALSSKTLHGSWAWVAPISFDSSLKAISMLFNGQTLEIVSEEAKTSPQSMRKLLSNVNLSVIDCTPTLLEFWLSIGLAPLLPNLFVGGEAINSSLWNHLVEWQATYGRIAINVYGPTECCVDTTATIIHGVSPHIGTSLDQCQVLMMDQNMQLLPDGAIGELCVAGYGLARGYLNNNELTSEKFTDFAIDNSSSMRLYRTGDLARYNGQGNIQYIGRIDQQIKHLGYRIELAEVEFYLEKINFVESAIVTLLVEEGSPSRLIAYFVASTNTDDLDFDAKIRSFLVPRLPAYMIPSTYLQIESIPLTTNGKIDLKALPTIQSVVSQMVLLKPKGEHEKGLCGIWSRLLNLPEELIGSNSNFFELGGNSLLSVRVVSEIRKLFSSEIKIRDVFEYSQLSDLAQLIKQSTRILRPEIKPVVKTSRGVPLSFAQQRLWFIDQLESGSAFYNIPIAFLISGDFDVDIAEQAISRIVQRHEMLRTVFIDSEHGPLQSVKDSFEFTIERHNISTKNKQQQKQYLIEATSNNLNLEFDLTQDLLIKVSFIQLNESKSALFFNTHHIASDGWSMSVLWNEFVAQYCSIKDSIETPLAALKIQYSDYSIWQRNWLIDEVLGEQLDYWKNQLNGLPTVHSLPLDEPRGELQSYRGAMHSFESKTGIVSKLNTLVKQHKVTKFMLMHAAFSYLLSRYSDSADVVIGTPVANRLQKELEPLIGFFVNTLILRVDVDTKLSLSEYLAKVKEVNLSAQANQDVTFEQLVEHLNPSRSTSYNPLFQIMLNMGSSTGFTGIQSSIPGIEIQPLSGEHSIAKFELTLNVIEIDDRFKFSFEYNRDLFQLSTIEALSESLLVVLESMPTHSQEPLSSIPVLTKNQRDKLVNDFNVGARASAQRLCIHELFEKQVLATPNNVAVVFEEQQLSYKVLNEKANQLAHLLLARGVVPDSVVGVCLERSLNLMVAILGILKSGAAYLPLDPAYPAERINYMLEHSQTDIVVTCENLRDEFKFKVNDTICLDIDIDETTLDNSNIDVSTIGLTLKNLAYVIYTSGSTGKPKGVAVEHRNETNLLHWYKTEYGIGSIDRVLVMTAIGFDLTQKNLLAPLICGASVEFATGRYFDVVEICNFIETRKITFTNCAPSAFYPLVDTQSSIQQLKSIRCVLFGGEAIAFERLESWLRSSSQQLKLINMYGPTECTDIACAYNIPLTQKNTNAPIGKPNSNVQLFILNKSFKLVPKGVAGELFIGGEGVSRGYLNEPDLTAASFLDAKLLDINSNQNESTSSSSKLYRTGDLVRWRKDGELEFIGRIDNQIKVRGFRVELGEIESVMASIGGINQAVVLYNESYQNLVGYIVSNKNNTLRTIDVTQVLRSKLPEYMIPKYFIFLDALPLTPHGKINKRALPQPEGQQVEIDYEAPITSFENQLCGIWSQLLHMDKNDISRNANFFELGGHSLLLTRMLHLIVETFGVRLSVRNIFKSPCVAEIASLIGLNDDCHDHYLLKKSSAMVSKNLSYSQYRVWFIEQLSEQTNQNNMIVGMRIKGDFQPLIMQQALNVLIARHEILRTIFVTIQDQPVQIVENKFDCRITVEDLSQLSTDVKANKVKALSNQFDTQTFNLAQLPLIKVLAIKSAKNDYVVHFNQHHITSDGWSQPLFFAELMKEYYSIAENNVCLVQTMPYQYSDYAIWQKNWLDSSEAASQKSFWEDYLKNCNEDITLPYQNIRGELGGKINTCKIVLELNVRDQLKRIAQLHKGSLFNVLHSTFVLLLARLSGQKDINIGLPVTGRHIYGTQNMLGMFLNNLPVRHIVDFDVSYTDFLRQQVCNIENVLSNQDVPFEQIVEIVGSERNTNSTPLFQVFFNMLNLPGIDESSLQSALKIETDKTAEIENKFNISMYLKDVEEGVYIHCHYNGAKFDSASMQQFLHQYVFLLTQVAQDTQQNCGLYSLNTLPQLLQHDAVIKRFENQDVVSQFRKQANNNLHAIAVIEDSAEWTYGELLNATLVNSQRLIEIGVKSGDVVSIVASRNASMVIAILSILQTGAAYSVITQEMPLDRVKQHLSIVKAAVVLLCEQVSDYQSEFINTLQHQCRVEGVICELSIIETMPVLFTPPVLPLSQVACITFTSGSTGIPKAIMGTHLGLSGYLDWLPDKISLSKNDRFSMLSGLAHDPLQRDIFGALCLGARLVIPSRKAYQHFQLVDWMIQHQISVIHITPAMAEAICSQSSEVISSLRIAFLTGETLRIDTAQELRKLGTSVRIFNCYGSTETQRAATYYEVDVHDDFGSIVPTSPNTQDTRLRLLNSSGVECGFGEIGQICTESHHIALGYLNDDALTKEKFLNLGGGLRRYYTGDLGVYADQRCIQYLGRADSQINIRGFRVELGEIEYHLSQLSMVKSSAVKVQDEQHIVAYVTLSDQLVNNDDVENSIKLGLKTKLLEYMIPSRIIVLQEIPLTINGKTDRSALPLVEFYSDKISFVLPHNEVEFEMAIIWAKLLKIPNEEISALDNFFELGGHSLLMLRLIAEIRNKFSLEVSIKSIFESENLRSISSLIDVQLQQNIIATQLSSINEDDIEEVEL